MPRALPPIPQRDTLQPSKHFSIKPLIAEIRRTVSAIPDYGTGRFSYSLVDVLMSGAAVFGLKFPSLLKFDENRQEKHIRHNLQTLYGVAQAPSDTQMREILDPLEPAELDKVFG